MLLNLGFMPLYLAKYFVISFDPNGPKSNAPKKVPNFNHFSISLGDSFPEINLLPIEAIVITGPHPTKFVHDISSPSPCPSSLNAVPKFMFNKFIGVR